jgi:hypothetical protein
VNASRFVKGFGITALIYSLVGVVGVPLLGGGIGLGVSLFIMRYDQAKLITPTRSARPTPKLQRAAETNSENESLFRRE